MIRQQIAIEQITPEYARDLLRNNIRNRNLSKRSIDIIAEQMRRGAWRASSDTIAVGYADDTNEIRLLNGQHRLHAVIQSGVTIEIPLQHIYGTLHEIIEVQQSMDQGRKRSLNNAIDMDTELDYLTDSLGRDNVTQAIIAQAIVDDLAGRGLKAFDALRPADRIRAFKESAEVARTSTLFAARVRQEFRRGTRDILPAGILAGAIATHRASPLGAKKFWYDVCNADRIPAKSPAMEMRTAALTRMNGRLRSLTGNGAHMAWYGVSLVAWNAFCRGAEAIRVLTVPDTTPIVSTPRHPVKVALQEWDASDGRVFEIHEIAAAAAD